jgi:cyanophycin synthetase
MRITGHRYLSGPNLHDDESGLLLVVDRQPLAALAAPGAVAPERCAEVFGALGLARLGERWAGEERPRPAEMLCRVAAALLAPVSIVPSAAQLLGGAPELRVFLRCEHEAAGLAAWDCAGQALLACRPGAVDEGAFAAACAAFAWWRQALQLGITARVFAREARRLGIPWYRLRIPGPFVQIGQGVHRRCLWNSTADSSGVISRLMSQDKALTSELLAAAGIPVLPSREVWDERQAIAAAEALGYPVVVKPCRGGAGRAVSVHLTDAAAVAAAYRRAAPGDSVLVEKYGPGDDHRVLVVAGQVVAASRRVPPQVEGDGTRSVAALLDALNADPRRAPGHDGLLTRVEIDDEVHAVLAEQGLGLDSVPAPGRRVLLRRTANLSTGGMAFDALRAMHPENRALLERTAAVMELGIVGIDFLIADMARPWQEAGGVVLELNATPGLRPHWVGDPDARVDERIMRALLPPGSDGRIPTCAITGTHGKTTTANMVARILEGCGLRVGRCTSVGVTVAGERRRSGDCAGGRFARTLLLDPTLEAGVFELARGGLLNEGMVIEDCEVGAVLNVLDNHIGSDGIASRADLARIKSIVARRARRALVLNAEDPLCLAMRDGARAERLWLAARDPAAPALAAHRAAGGAAAFLADGVIRLAPDGGAGEAVIPVAAIPATLGGHHEGKQWNALFAAAVAHAMGAPVGRIRDGLAGFRPDMADAQGRCSIIERHGVRVLLDYGTGGEAIAMLAAAARAMAVAGRRLAYVMAAGRSEDALIRATGRALAGGFDLYVCTDWAKRPRPDPAAVPRLLAEGLLAGGVPPGRILCRPGEDDALRLLLARARPGDLVVVVTGEVERAAAIVESFVPAPVSPEDRAPVPWQVLS